MDFPVDQLKPKQQTWGCLKKANQSQWTPTAEINIFTAWSKNAFGVPKSLV